MPNIQEPLRVFLSYSHKDKEMKEQLVLHLNALIRQKYISLWYDNMVLPGKEIDANVLEALRNSQIALLLLSADYLASDYCYNIEMKEALALRNEKKMEVIPVLLRAVDLKGTPADGLLTLPEDRKAVVQFRDKDAAFENIAKGVRRVAESLRRKSIPFLNDGQEQRYGKETGRVEAAQYYDNHGFQFFGNIYGGNFCSDK